MFIGGVSIHPAYTTYEDGTECSETSVHKIQMPGNRPLVEYNVVKEALNFSKYVRPIL
jgi:hypothetical protein